MVWRIVDIALWGFLIGAVAAFDASMFLLAHGVFMTCVAAFASVFTWAQLYAFYSLDQGKGGGEFAEGAS